MMVLGSFSRNLTIVIVTFLTVCIVIFVAQNEDKKLRKVSEPDDIRGFLERLSQTIENELDDRPYPESKTLMQLRKKDAKKTGKKSNNVPQKKNKNTTQKAKPGSSNTGGKTVTQKAEDKVPKQHDGESAVTKDEESSEESVANTPEQRLIGRSDVKDGGNDGGNVKVLRPNNNKKDAVLDSVDSLESMVRIQTGKEDKDLGPALGDLMGRVVDLLEPESEIDDLGNEVPKQQFIGSTDAEDSADDMTQAQETEAWNRFYPKAFSQGAAIPIAPSSKPTKIPTTDSSSTLSATPTLHPSVAPTAAPTSKLSLDPTRKASSAPTASPSSQLTTAPTAYPSAIPSVASTPAPSVAATKTPTAAPSSTPTAPPSSQPTKVPTAYPSTIPSAASTPAPTVTPTKTPTAAPSRAPSTAPSNTPTSESTDISDLDEEVGFNDFYRYEIDECEDLQGFQKYYRTYCCARNDRPALGGIDVVDLFSAAPGSLPKPGRQSISAEIATGFGNFYFLFRTDQNKQLFVENPWRFVPSYGGFCACGMALEEKVTEEGYKNKLGPYIDLQYWTIKNNRLYFFGGPEPLVKFLENDSNVELGDDHWRSFYSGELYDGAINTNCFHHQTFEDMVKNVHSEVVCPFRNPSQRQPTCGC